MRALVGQQRFQNRHILFKRSLNLDESEQAIARLESAIKEIAPSLHYLYLGPHVLQGCGNPEIIDQL